MSKEERARKRKLIRNSFYFKSDILGGIILLASLLLLVLSFCCWIAFQAYSELKSEGAASISTNLYIGFATSGWILLLFFFVYLFLRKALLYGKLPLLGYYPRSKGRCLRCNRPLPLQARFCPSCGKKAINDLHHGRKEEVVDEIINSKRDPLPYGELFRVGLIALWPYSLFLAALAAFLLLLTILDFYAELPTDGDLFMLLFTVILLFLSNLLYPIFHIESEKNRVKESSVEVRQTCLNIHKVYIQNHHFMTLEASLPYQDCLYAYEGKEAFYFLMRLGGRRYFVYLSKKGMDVGTESFLAAKVIIERRRIAT